MFVFLFEETISENNDLGCKEEISDNLVVVTSGPISMTIIVYRVSNVLC